MNVGAELLISERSTAGQQEALPPRAPRGPMSNAMQQYDCVVQVSLSVSTVY